MMAAAKRSQSRRHVFRNVKVILTARDNKMEGSLVVMLVKMKEFIFSKLKFTVKRVCPNTMALQHKNLDGCKLIIRVKVAKQRC